MNVWVPAAPRLELRHRDYPAVVEHRSVPQPAELSTPDRDLTQMRGLGVSDIVHARIGVGLHAELVGPEAVDHVDRRDVELDPLALRQDQVRRLKPVELRIAVGKPPPLADDLYHEPR